METQIESINEELINDFKRRQLLPWWIKICIWIFLVFGAILPFALIFGMMGYKFQISLYGMETNNPLSIIGIGLLIIFLLKAVTAYGLWREKDWAVNLGIVDAVSGILLCIFSMFIAPILSSQKGFTISLRLELILLIPYLLKLLKVNKIWNIATNHLPTRP